MAPQQRIDLIDALEASRRELLEAVGAIPEAQAKSRPETGRWSVLECLEHLILSEERLLRRFESSPLRETAEMDRKKEADLAIRVPDRSTRAEAPEGLRPTGQIGALAEALHRFNSARDRTIEFAQDRASDLYSISFEHQRFGSLNGAEWMVLLAGHVRRHAAQIKEAKVALGIS
jgi:uncharacterized damage-inducible protein DinB